MNKNNIFGHTMSIFIPILMLVVSTTVYASSFTTKLGENQSSKKDTTTLNSLKTNALDKASQAIEDYLNYITTNQTDYVVDGIKHAAEAKLLLDLYIQKLSKPADKELIEFIEDISRLSGDIPKEIFRLHPLQDIRPFATYISILKVMLKKVSEIPKK